MNRKELAKSYFLNGYTCSQAVVLAFNDLLKMDETTLLKLASPFGGGMGRLREVCGALSGAYIVLGYLKGNETTNLKKKEILYQHVQAIAKEFEKINGFIRCRDLLKLVDKSDPTPSKRDKNYYHARPCVDIVISAVTILEKYLK